MLTDQNCAVKASSSVFIRAPSVANSSSHRPLWPAFLCESLSSLSAVMLTVGIFFFTEHYFRWGLTENFLLAAAQGGVYVRRLAARRTKSPRGSGDAAG